MQLFPLDVEEIDVQSAAFLGFLGIVDYDAYDGAVGGIQNGQGDNMNLVDGQ